MCNPQTIETRLPVWSGLSEFFLDTELQEDDHQRIAAVLANSPYTIAELEDILKYEVYPPLRWNLLSVAGEWSMFDEDWLCEQISPLCDKRPKFRLPLLQWGMIKHHWARVSSILSQQQQKMSNKLQMATPRKPSD